MSTYIFSKITAKNNLNTVNLDVTGSSNGVSSGTSSLTGVEDVSGSGSWAVDVFSGGTLANGALILNGGLGVASNVIISDDNATHGLPVVNVEQTSGTGIETMKLTQGNNTGAFLNLSGRSTDHSGGTSTTLDGTIVDGAVGSTNITSAEVSGYCRISITDNNSSGNGITSGTFFIPFYSLT